MTLERSWFLAAASAEVPASQGRPLGRTILGRSVVLFRDAQGRVAALEDRCPHRNVALSLGTLREGLIECPYHGWRFDGSGACQHAPCAGPSEALPKRCAPSYRVAEQEGSVWLSFDANPLTAVPTWPHHGDPAYPSFELVNLVRSPMLLVLNNFVDCGHTGFVHKGLFRSAPNKTVTAHIEERATGVHIETFGESDTNSVVARLLSPSGGELRHTDEYLVPHTVKVDYWLGRAHAVTVSVCTPEEEGVTRIWTRVSLRMGALSPALLPVLKAMTQKIILQDKVILENQAAQLAKFGKPLFASMESDTPTVWVTRAHDAFAAGRFPPPELRRQDVTYTL